MTVIVAIIYIPTRLGGWGHIFGAASTHFKTRSTRRPASRSAASSQRSAGEWAYATLALGSALALFMYPHAITGVFATKRRDVIRRNMAILPAYSLVLGLIALFGYMALATPAVNAGGQGGRQQHPAVGAAAVQHMFPSWFAGIGYSAIVIGALVPAAIMSIAAANLFTRNIYKEFFRPGASPARGDAGRPGSASLVMKFGALLFALELSKTFSINLQLLGGVWILQTFPSIVVGLYTRWLHRWALLIGWAAAMAYGTIEAYRTPGGGQQHFGASTAPVFGHVIYIAIAALVINLVVSVVLTLIFRAVELPAGTDETLPAQYTADPADGAAAAVPAAAGKSAA